MDWFVWRLLTSQDLHLSRAELEGSWCVEDVCEAHQALDDIDEARAIRSHGNG